ncbi:membrane protein [Flexibacter flexilis DSM 6793]|uniref:Membrane protein n=1 Tax=Flexibacter flexilis DSM 6793 TaxID=927664 RepID=A0A1I1FI71_9BACT|nr:YihY/virulence factor BrkB family protein [Flexibacter flexilis]SFB98981.1 membrane protein [Flexibacter flexilis DSM 6793]
MTQPFSIQKWLSNTWSFTLQLKDAWDEDNCFRLAAALSYYTIFSLAPMIIIVISTAGYFFGKEAVAGQIFTQAKDIIGEEGALGLQNMVQNAYLQHDSFITKVIGGGTLIFSATATFTVLQDSLNTIWDVKAKPSKGWLKFLINRVLSFALVMAIGFLLLVSLVIHTILIALQSFIEQILDSFSVYLISTAQFAVSFGIITLMFAMMFKFLPDVRLRWRNVWRASILTAALFSVGRYLISLYLGNTNLASTYGAAASVVIIIMWVNYSALIFFLGAEYIHVYMLRRGENIWPSKQAVRIIRTEEPHQPH